MAKVLYDPSITLFNNKAKIVLSKDYMAYVDLAFLSKAEYYDVVVDYLLNEKDFQQLTQEEAVISVIASNTYTYPSQKEVIKFVIDRYQKELQSLISDKYFIFGDDQSRKSYPKKILINNVPYNIMVREQCSSKKKAVMAGQIFNIFDIYEELDKNSQKVNYEVETTFFIYNLVRI